MKKMLLVFAHPDDESYSAAGTVAKYVKAGWQVDLLCATRGEAGHSGPYEKAGDEHLGMIRQKELEAAATLLGISSLTFLGYKDGKLAEEQPGELEDKIYEKLEELIPDCIITYDTTGISNHPDHVKICYATTFAFQKYALWVHNQLKNLKDFDEESEPKLYYACMPKTVAQYLLKKKIIPAESYGMPWRGTEDKFITTVISIKTLGGVKKKALLSHISQEAEIKQFLSIKNNPLLLNEYFILRMHGLTEVFMGKNDIVSSKL
ncbi:MAG TPA: PIG-L family deacetylase [Patescibacteria group bacterium]|jgi:LmbE family N-acetylglucosaminyl deacetylase|nr:PIG-L family deacetylase [Patescibacteria group bacterium]